ncbi:MAG TPA: hypothetical protein PKJ99_15675 [Thermoanaerobaculales bacterium]|nr:hypothetical protein [Thermoanaerobaculales bacterium]HPA82002.1 hypothetical protein [Thermoanaerobaculales bacterium]
MVDRFSVDSFLDDDTVPPKRVVLDVDTTDDALHGEQERGE